MTIGWDAVQEMRANPEVRYRLGHAEFRFRDGKLQHNEKGSWVNVDDYINAGELAQCGWERVVEPLTDEDLAQAWERQASIDPIGSGYVEAMALRRCAAQLRARKLDM